MKLKEFLAKNIEDGTKLLIHDTYYGHDVFNDEFTWERSVIGRTEDCCGRFIGTEYEKADVKKVEYKDNSVQITIRCKDNSEDYNFYY